MTSRTNRTRYNNKKRARPNYCTCMLTGRWQCKSENPFSRHCHKSLESFKFKFQVLEQKNGVSRVPDWFYKRNHLTARKRFGDTDNNNNNTVIIRKPNIFGTSHIIMCFVLVWKLVDVMTSTVYNHKPTNCIEPLLCGPCNQPQMNWQPRTTCSLMACIYIYLGQKSRHIHSTKKNKFPSLH